jgi:hypothetical protein
LCRESGREWRPLAHGKGFTRSAHLMVCSLDGVQSLERARLENAKTGFCAISSGLARFTHHPQTFSTSHLAFGCIRAANSNIAHQPPRCRSSPEKSRTSSSFCVCSTPTYAYPRSAPMLRTLQYPELPPSIPRHAKPQALACIARRQEKTSVDVKFSTG